MKETTSRCHKGLGQMDTEILGGKELKQQLLRLCCSKAGPNPTLPQWFWSLFSKQST